MSSNNNGNNNKNDSNKKPEDEHFQGYTMTYLLEAIPRLPRAMAIIILICNIFFPSSGTFYMACIGGKLRKTQFVVGGAQLLLTALVIGWVWSIYWGIKALGKSYSYSESSRVKEQQLSKK